MRGLLIKYGPEGADMQVVGPGYRFANAPGSPDDTVIDYDVATRKLVIRTDLFGVYPVNVLVRDGRLWAADSLARLHDLPETPKGMLPLGACVALCIAPAQRPSVFACGLSVIGGSVIDCTPERIRTTPYWGKSPGVDLDETSLPQLRTAVWNAFKSFGNRALLCRDDDEPGVMNALHMDYDAKPEMIGYGAYADEDLPADFEAAVVATETVLADDVAARNMQFCRSFAAKGGNEFCTTLGLASLLARDPVLQPGSNGLPTFVNNCEAERRLALKLVKAEFASRVKLPDWDKDLQSVELLNDARQLFLRTVLLSNEVPALGRVAAANGLVVRAPFLHAEIARLALSVRAQDASSMGIPFSDRVGRKPVSVPIGGVSPRARANWIALYDKWLSGERLEALEVVDVGATREMLIAYAKLHSYAPPRVTMDRVLKKLTSLSILRERLS